MGGISQDVRNVELSLLNLCQQICEQEHIPFYLAQGTLLGAVRHKGFIPWDDDIDLLLPIDGLERFAAAFAREKHGEVVLERFQDNPHVPIPWTKLCDAGTTSMPQAYQAIPICWGIGIDLFPYYCIRDGRWAHFQARACFLVAKRMLGVTMTFYEKRVKWSSRVVRLLPANARCQIAAAILSWLQKQQGEGEDVFVFCRGGRFLKRRWMEGAPCYLPFEGRNYPVPADPEAFLTAMYGDYRTLPPPAERQGHDLKMGEILWDSQKSYREYRSLPH